MKHQPTPQFFLSMESDCPYIEGNRERKIFTSLTKDHPQKTQNTLSHLGFRRSQNIIYRPACSSCSACVSARIPVKAFTPSRQQKRVVAKNRHIVREVRQTLATDEQYELFLRYVQTRHRNGGMSDMSIEEFAAMIEQTLVSARVIEYRLFENNRPGQLIAACLTDIIEDGISMVYSFYDPDFAHLSLGTYMILDHIELCKNAHLDFVYLGYWVKNAPSMKYKANFAPFELFLNSQWTHFENPNLAEPELITAPKILHSVHKKMIDM